MHSRPRRCEACGRVWQAKTRNEVCPNCGGKGDSSDEQAAALTNTLTNTAIGAQAPVIIEDPAARASSPTPAPKRPRIARRVSLGPYDPTLIYEFASRLYAQAWWVVVSCACLGFVVGALIALGFEAAWASSQRFAPNEFASRYFPAMVAVVLSGALLGAFIGYLIGQEFAFWIRLRAQLVLCQLKIEENTRRPAKT